jgi:hypothetical protein
LQRPLTLPLPLPPFLTPQFPPFHQEKDLSEKVEKDVKDLSDRLASSPSSEHLGKIECTLKRDVLKTADVIFDYVPVKSMYSNLPVISNACKKDAIVVVRADYTQQGTTVLYQTTFNIRDGRDTRLICISTTVDT